MRQDIRWQLHPLSAAQGLAGHRADWDRLNHQLMAGHGMLDGAFVDALLRHFGDKGVLLAVARASEETVAMLLLGAQPRGLGVWSTFLPAQAQIGPFLIKPGLDLSGLLSVLPGHAVELDLLCNDPQFGDLREHPGRPARSLPHALTMSVALREGFDDYWAQRPRKLIQNMRRYLRRLQSEEGQERLAVLTAPEDMPEALARYAQLEGSGWKGRQGTAVSSDNPQGRFYGEVLQAFAARGEAAVYELWLGDDLLASRLVLLHDRMAIMLKTAFDERFERLAPGRVLLLRTLEDLFSRAPGATVEFYTDADADLLAWSTSQRWIQHISVYRHRGLPAALNLLRRGARAFSGRNPERPVDSEIMVSRSGATVETYVHVRELPADALALLNEAEASRVEFGADWYANLIDTVFAREPHNSQVRVHVLRRQGRVLAVLPTVARSGALGREIGALSNFYTALYAPALAEGVQAGDLLPLTRALRKGSARAAAYRFSPMDPHCREFRALEKALAMAGLSTHTYFAFGNWYQPLGQSWADYLKERSGQIRNVLKRSARKFAAEGGRLEVVRDGPALEQALHAYEAVYARSWKVPEPYPDFVPGLIRLGARRGWLRMGLAWLGDKPIAAQLWIVAHGRAEIHKLAYDEAHKSFAPGTLLTAALMEHAIDIDQVTEIDYLIGDDPYKAAWMSHRRERFGLVAYDPFTIRGLLGLVRQAIGAKWRRWRPPTPPRNDNPAA